MLWSKPIIQQTTHKKAKYSFCVEFHSDPQNWGERKSKKGVIHKRDMSIEPFLKLNRTKKLFDGHTLLSHDLKRTYSVTYQNDFF